MDESRLTIIVSVGVLAMLLAVAALCCCSVTLRCGRTPASDCPRDIKPETKADTGGGGGKPGVRRSRTSASGQHSRRPSATGAGTERRDPEDDDDDDDNDEPEVVINVVYPKGHYLDSIFPPPEHFKLHAASAAVAPAPPAAASHGASGVAAKAGGSARGPSATGSPAPATVAAAAAGARERHPGATQHVSVVAPGSQQQHRFNLDGGVVVIGGGGCNDPAAGAVVPLSAAEQARRRSLAPVCYTEPARPTMPSGQMHQRLDVLCAPPKPLQGPYQTPAVPCAWNDAAAAGATVAAPLPMTAADQAAVADGYYQWSRTPAPQPPQVTLSLQQQQHHQYASQVPPPPPMLQQAPQQQQPLQNQCERRRPQHNCDFDGNGSELAENENNPSLGDSGDSSCTDDSKRAQNVPATLVSVPLPTPAPAAVAAAGAGRRGAASRRQQGHGGDGGRRVVDLGGNHGAGSQGFKRLEPTIPKGPDGR